jgi:dTDP-4-amino-4,6-dideoxygalactose transaminase
MKPATTPKQQTDPFPGWPIFAQDEIDAATAILKSGKVNYWTGQEGRQFEQKFAEYCGTNHAVAVANGTLALELALRALGIGTGDEVVVPPRTFIATASAVVMVGAIPVFADVDPDSQNITADTIRAVLSPKTRAVIPVHLAGWPCDMDPINDLARENNLKVIEDCAQAHGATYKGRPVGSLGDVGAFSFCQDKIMTTGGEGGMLVTNNSAVWKTAWAFKDHGKNYDTVYNQRHPPGFRWLHDSFGTNWRMTEMQSAIGRVQLKKLDQWVTARRKNAHMLTKTLSACPAIRITEPPENIGHAYYKYYAFVRPERLRDGWDRDRIMNAITETGTPCFSGICPEIYLEEAFQRSGIAPASRLPEAKKLGETSLMFVVHPTLEARHMQTACDALVTVLAGASQ